MYQLVQAIVGITIILFSSTLGLRAQNNPRIIPANMRDNDFKYYKGRIDDISDVSVSLKCEGNNCNGSLIYLRSKDEFRLKGNLQGTVLKLQEFNLQNKLTGYLIGKMEGTSINLDWKNKNEEIGYSINLTEVPRIPDFPTFCGDNKWINVYSGRLKGKGIRLILQRVDNDRILGHAYLEGDKEKIIIKGELTANDNLHLRFFKEGSLDSFGTVRGIFKEKQNLSVSFYNTQNIQEFIPLALEKTLEVNCLEYADFYTNYDFIFPKSTDAIFNEVMVLLTKDWIDECRTHSRESRKQPTNAAFRASQRAYSWTEIELLNEDFISGMLTYHTTWSEQEQTKTFNYDLSSNSIIELAAIFKKKFHYQSFIKKYIDNEIKKETLYKQDAEFRKWINQEDFPFFTIGKEGISFFTAFHFIYGRQRVLIPYKKLKSHIRKKSPIRSLM